MGGAPSDLPAPNRNPLSRGPGRPSKLTPQVEARILNAIRCGATNVVACEAAGIHQATFYGWMEKARERPGSEYARFEQKLAQARKEGIVARLAIIQKAAPKDWRAAAWLLERDQPDQYSLKLRVQHEDRPPTFLEALAMLRPDRRPRLLRESEG